MLLVFIKNAFYSGFSEQKSDRKPENVEMEKLLTYKY